MPIDYIDGLISTIIIVFELTEDEIQNTTSFRYQKPPKDDGRDGKFGSIFGLKLNNNKNLPHLHKNILK